ncbi:MAG: hypothetical protein ACE5DX_05730 [Candidatus Dojkabacteria bacterium]
MAAHGRRDLLYFGREILGYDWVNEVEHRELCDFLMSEDRKKIVVIACSRDTLKSTICSQIYPLWRMAQGRTDLRVLLDSEVRDHSKARLNAIQAKLDTETWFRRCYGEWNGKSKGYKWNEEEATIAVREDTSIREASFETAGVDVVKNSRHYDLIVPDDCHSDNNSKSRTQIQKVMDHYRLLQPMLNPDGEFIIVCTWWDDKDANRWFVDMMGNDVSLFERGAYLDEAQTKPRYPKRLPLKTLALKRKIMGTYLFSCQYLLNPVSTEDALFHESDIRITKDEDVPKLLRRYLLVDPAGDPTANSDEKRDSDNWAIGLLECSPSGSIFLRDLAWGKMDSTEGVEEIIKMITAYNPHVVGIEKVGLGNTGFYVKQKLRQMGRFAVVEDLNPGGRSKTARVDGLTPIVRMRKFHIVSSCPFREETIEEFIKFTRFGSKARHDDIVDMCAYVLDMIKKYGVALEEEKKDARISETERLMYLNPNSKKHWMAYHKMQADKDGETWADEFV